jgi:hypothetical protein
MIEEHGREHPWVKINVLGEFPDVADRQAARARRRRALAGRGLHERGLNQEPLIIGIDTAGGAPT